MQDVFNQTLTLFIIMLIGLLTAKLNIFTHEVRRKLSVFLLNVLSPLIIIVNFQRDYSKDILVNMGIISIVAFAAIGGGLLLGSFIWRKSLENKKAVLHYATGFPNCGYLGYPVLGGLFGAEGIMYTAIFVMVFYFFMWTIGIKIFSGKSAKWYSPLIRPAIIAIFIGIIMFIFSIKLPVPIFDAFSMVGGMISPVAMLLVGSYLADSKIKEIFTDKHIYLVSIVRFIFIPAIIYFIIKPFNLSDIVFISCVVLSAMPAAASTVILATRFDKNPKFASRLVALTTLIAMLTIPVWIYIVTVF